MLVCGCAHGVDEANSAVWLRWDGDAGPCRAAVRCRWLFCGRGVDLLRLTGFFSNYAVMCASWRPGDLRLGVLPDFVIKQTTTISVQGNIFRAQHKQLNSSLSSL